CKELRSRLRVGSAEFGTFVPVLRTLGTPAAGTGNRPAARAARGVPAGRVRQGDARHRREGRKPREDVGDFLDEVRAVVLAQRPTELPDLLDEPHVGPREPASAIPFAEGRFDARLEG